ncbi:MAG: hypothetical protein QOI62_361, partial [Solirubrobacteraceae bacterium]|nr:hypothetical protein [Solirubrobacteraceae bacterium]
MAEVRFRLLGPVEVSVDGRPLALGATKQRALLAMLALSPNTVVSADRLMEGLWGEHPPASASKMVQLYVSQLRKRLSGADGAEIVTRGRGYELRVNPDAVDVVRAEALVGERSQARAAAALFCGPPLADVADEPFAAQAIRRLEELRARALLAALEGDVAGGRHDAALPEIEALLAEDP